MCCAGLIVTFYPLFESRKVILRIPDVPPQERHSQCSLQREPLQQRVSGDTQGSQSLQP